MTTGEYLIKTAQLFPEKIALTCGNDKRTYRDINESSDLFSNYLVQNGLKLGDRVAVFLDNSPESVISIFGIFKAGGVIVLINTATPAERMGYILQNCQPKFLVAHSFKQNILVDTEKKCTEPPAHILVGADETIGGVHRFENACSKFAGDTIHVVTDEDIAAIVYTSGSTGKPKGVTLTHKNFDVVTDAVGEYLEHTPDDIILDFLPLTITYGLLQLLVTFRTGGTLVLEKGFGFPYEIIKRLKEKNVTGFAGVPTVYSMIMRLQLEGETFPNLRYITNAAAALPYSFIPRLRQIFPTAKIYLMHGLTECMRTTYLPPDQIDIRPTSVGKGMKYVKLQIQDSHGNELPHGQVGELVVMGPNIMKGYWNDPDATNKVLRDGKNPGEKILHTGDLFRTDEEGYFYYVSRMDDVIKSRGLKVSPLEVENVLYLCEDILEVRVIGVPDEVLGMAVKAEIVLKKGSQVTKDQIKSHCQNKLEDFQIPGIIEFVPSLPKSAGGKIRRV
jgi:long-chain acyl-CoA synthetase